MTEEPIRRECGRDVEERMQGGPTPGIENQAHRPDPMKAKSNINRIHPTSAVRTKACELVLVTADQSDPTPFCDGAKACNLRQFPPFR